MPTVDVARRGTRVTSQVSFTLYSRSRPKSFAANHTCFRILLSLRPRARRHVINVPAFDSDICQCWARLKNIILGAPSSASVTDQDTWH